jgi:hypothetical protein
MGERRLSLLLSLQHLQTHHLVLHPVSWYRADCKVVDILLVAHTLEVPNLVVQLLPNDRRE